MIGLITHYAVLPPPPGWLECGGQAVSRTKYAELNALLAAYGYPYGNGNGTTTFNVPDLRGRVMAGPNLMGGAQLERLTNDPAGGVSGSAIGNGGGEESHTLDNGEAVQNTILVDMVSPSVSLQSGTDFGTITSGGNSHNNVQPTLIVPAVIYTGVMDGDSIGT